MIGMQRQESSNVRCEDSINAALISGSAPPTRTRLRCDMVGDQFILAIKLITWLMEESSG